MKNSPSDPRVIRTQESLRTALMELVAEKSFANLTIQDVTDRAGLNRTTFYLHYTGLHELLEDCARTLFANLRANIYLNNPTGVQEDMSALMPYVECVFHHLESHRKFYQAMLGRYGNPYFRDLFQEMLTQLIFEPIAKEAQCEEPGQKFDMAMRFYSAGFTGIASWWLENDMPVSVEQASQQVIRDILPGYLRLLIYG
jgi:AcrR family transcriptional regulator